jgi:hypothetical protein
VDISRAGAQVPKCLLYQAWYQGAVERWSWSLHLLDVYNIGKPTAATCPLIHHTSSSSTHYTNVLANVYTFHNTREPTCPLTHHRTQTLCPQCRPQRAAHSRWCPRHVWWSEPLAVMQGKQKLIAQITSVVCCRESGCADGWKQGQIRRCAAMRCVVLSTKHGAVYGNGTGFEVHPD